MTSNFQIPPKFAIGEIMLGSSCIFFNKQIQPTHNMIKITFSICYSRPYKKDKLDYQMWSKNRCKIKGTMHTLAGALGIPRFQLVSNREIIYQILLHIVIMKEFHSVVGYPILNRYSPLAIDDSMTNLAPS